MYQIKHISPLALLAIGKVTGLPSPDIHGNQESCLKEHNLCARSNDTITSFTLCKQRFLVCLKSLPPLNNDEKISPGLAVQIPMSPLTSLDDLSSFYCPQPSDEKDPRCTVSCEPDVPSYPYFSSPTDCTKFCQCTTDGAPLAQECPEGLEWDQNTLTCNYPYEGNCRLQHECQEISFTASPSVHGGLDVSGDSVMCPQKGDVANENCTVTCEPGTQYYPHPRECGRFCQCSNGRPYDQPCPDGLHWDPALEVCNYPGAANCQLLPEC